MLNLYQARTSRCLRQRDGYCTRRRDDVCTSVDVPATRILTHRCRWTDSPGFLTYDELKAENQRLRDEIELLKRQQVSSSPTLPGEKLRRSLGNDDELEKRLWKLVSASSLASPTATSWGSVVMPSRRCSEQLVEFDRVWNSWVHYALEYPAFEIECDHFYAELEKGCALEDYDPAWLSVYFAVLCVSHMLSGL